MSLINYCANPDGNSEIEWIPVFELFARRLANTEFEPLRPSDVAQMRTGDLDALPQPSPLKRLEMERTPGIEEVRWIDTTNGTYLSCKGQAARGIIEDWDRGERELFAGADPDPEEFISTAGMSQRDCAYHRCIVEYDQDGIRSMPLRRKAGPIEDASDFWRRADDPSSWIFIGTNTAFCACTKSGDYWVASGKDLVDRIKEGPNDGSPKQLGADSST